MRLKKDSVIRTLSKKYQLTIPKKFGRDLGLQPPTPVSVREDFSQRRIIIQPLGLTGTKEMNVKRAFISACRTLGKRWSRLGITEKDIRQVINEHREFNE